MKMIFILPAALIAGGASSALAIGANQSFYIYHDMEAKKCSVVKEKPTTGTIGTGEIFESEQAAQAAIAKLPECKNSGK